MNTKLSSSKKCRFCQIFEQRSKNEKIDRPISMDDNFMALVSKGAIVKGWVLVIPKDHTYSMRKYYCDDRFIHFTNGILYKIREKFGKNCLIFEHGANRCDSLTSCGTNHAHLHVVPYDKSLLIEMKKNGLGWIKCKPREIESLVGEHEYWFYAENVKSIENIEGYLHIIKQPESQYFRKLIAEKEGCLEKFSYKEFRFLENEESTYELLMG